MRFSVRDFTPILTAKRLTSYYVINTMIKVQCVLYVLTNGFYQLWIDNLHNYIKIDI